MSAFLGPIHYWMYHKIQVQQNLVEEIVTYSKEMLPGLKKELVQRFGESETRPLEEVIDVGNIHGWLQQQVSQVEYKLAYCVTAILNHANDKIVQLQQIFYDNGKRMVDNLELTNAAQSYKLIQDSLLDGMPCDHVNTVMKESDTETAWRKNTCIHGSYWAEVDGNIDIYYLLRESFIKGLLSESNFVYEKIDQDTSRIVKKNN